MALWLLGYPEAASAEIDHAFKVARETAHAPTLMFALGMTTFTQICCRNYARANAQINECIALAEEKSTANWKMQAMAHRGCVLALVGKSTEAIQTISCRDRRLALNRSNSLCNVLVVAFSFGLCRHRKIRRMRGSKIDETMTAMETTKEKWCEAEVNRIAGEDRTRSRPRQMPEKAEAYFERALAVARQQQAKSWELRAAMSLARLWRDQGKVQQARELLAPVYGWFTEGFETRDLKEAKVLLKGVGGVKRLLRKQTTPLLV